MKHLINWVEIPVTDMERAVEFYKKILDADFYETIIEDIKYALFPSEDQFNCGALAQGPYYTPSTNGVTIYLDGGRDLDLILKKVAEVGGTILVEKMFLSKEAGYIGVFLDSEGNKIGLQHL
jgi:predicted enzyme related to lactoylglutathione lyase